MLDSVLNARNTFEQKLLILENDYGKNLLQNACQRSMYTSAEVEEMSRLLEWCGQHYRMISMQSGAFEGQLDVRLEAEETFSRQVQALPLNLLPNEIVFIVAAQTPMQSLLNAVDQAAAIAGNRGFQTLVGISAESRIANELHTLYQQAHRRLTPWNGAQNWCETDPQEKAAAFPLEINAFGSLINTILMGSEHDAQRFFDELEERARTVHDPAVLMELVCALRIALQEAAASTSYSGDLVHLPPAVLNEDIHTCLLPLREYCSALCAASQTNKSNSMAQDILAYVSAHCSDADLSALTVGEAFGFSEKYVFHIVRQSTGKTLGMLIEDARFELACSLLSETGMSNEEVAQKAGFGTTNTFYRLFKKRFGITPGAWRTANRKAPE